MSLNYKLPSGYVMKEVSNDELNKFYPKLAKKLFNDMSMFYEQDMVDTKKETARFVELRKEFKPNVYRLNLVIYYKNKVAGWAWGFQDTAYTFYMCNSAILKNHRRKNLYSCLMKETLKRTIKMGFEKIYSRHVVTNNAIIISKLKEGFKITGTELHERFGSMVILSYFPQKIKNDILDFRSGLVRPDKKMKKIFKL